MKLALTIAASALCFITASAQQDSSRKQDPNSHNKTVPGQNQEKPPVSNKIAVSDPGVPLEKGKPSSTNRKSAGTKPEEKKKNTAVTPK